MNQTGVEERFVKLEVKAAYLEKLALDLNEVVISQAQLLSDLATRLERLERQLRTGGEPDERIPDERPPHY